MYQIGFVGPEETEKCTVHTITADWGESDITWNIRKGDDRWQDIEELKFIGKYDPDFGFMGDTIYRGGEWNPDDAVIGNPAGINQWESYDVTDRIQEMVNGDRENYGFLIKTWFHNSAERSYSSSKADNVEDRPKLTITYDGTAISFGKNKFEKGLMELSTLQNGINVSFKKSGNYTVSLRTISGRTLQKNGVDHSKSHFIGTEGLAKGVYLLNISGSEINYTRSIVIR